MNIRYDGTVAFWLSSIPRHGLLQRRNTDVSIIFTRIRRHSDGNWNGFGRYSSRTIVYIARLPVYIVKFTLARKVAPPQKIIRLGIIPFRGENTSRRYCM